MKRAGLKISAPSRATAPERPAPRTGPPTPARCGAEPFRHNPVLAAEPPEAGRRRRRLLMTSAAVHLVLFAGMWLLSGRFVERDQEPRRIDIVFYTPPAPPPEVVREVAPAPRPRPVEVARVEPVERPPAPRPQPVPRPRRQTPRPVAEQPPVVARREPAPVETRREVRTTTFEEAPQTAAATTPERKTRTGTFGRSAGSAEEPTGAATRVVASGRFGGGSVSVPRPGNPAPRRTVTSTGFDAAAVADAEPASAARVASVRQGGFGDTVAAAPAPRRRERPAQRLDTPVEIVSKPAPVYTAPAREQRIEGEVVLEVVFSASGRLRVLRVRDGLGHGLDEAAIEAAEQIRFTPARRDGRPVDHTTTLRVVFRLA